MNKGIKVPVNHLVTFSFHFIDIANQGLGVSQPDFLYNDRGGGTGGSENFRLLPDPCDVICYIIKHSFNPLCMKGLRCFLP